MEIIINKFYSNRFFTAMLPCSILFALTLFFFTSPKDVKAAGVVNPCTEDQLSIALNNGGTVTFDCDGIIAITSQNTISAHTTIDATGHNIILDSSGSSSFFSVRSGITLTLRNLTIQNGVDVQGGAITIPEGGTLIITDSHFINNHATGEGGAIFADVTSGFPATIQIFSSYFINNTTNVSGGAISIDGGEGGETITALLEIEDSVFRNNQTLTSGNGGAILANYHVTINSEGTLYANNLAMGEGGAIAVMIPTGITNLANNTFSGNGANLGGEGGNGGALFLKNSNLTHNTFFNNRVGAGGAFHSGSAIYWNLSGLNIIMHDNIFHNNTGAAECMQISTSPTGSSGNLTNDGSCNTITTNPNKNPVNFFDASLQKNGGPTETHALYPGSNAIDSSSSCTYESTGTNNLFSSGDFILRDQRNVTRPQNSVCDKGAFEVAYLNLKVDTTTDSNDPAFQVCSSTDNDCSLRGAISKANNDTANTYLITFDPDLNNSPLILTLNGASENANATGDLDITDSLIIKGNGARMTTVTANGIDRVFDINGAGIVIINDLTIQGGLANTDSGGGGISNVNTDTTLNRVLIQNNEAVAGVSLGGGGIFQNLGSLTINNSTINANTTAISGTGGGGIYCESGTLHLINSTLTSNAANNGTSAYGGGIYNGSCSAKLIHTTATGNSATTAGAGLYTTVGNTELLNSIITNHTSSDCDGPGSFSGSNNLIDDFTSGPCSAYSSAAITNLDENLQDNGGPTLTHALLSGSNAIDGAPSSDCQNTQIHGIDQRWMGRNYDGEIITGECDIGAVEYRDPIQFCSVNEGNNYTFGNVHIAIPVGGAGNISCIAVEETGTDHAASPGLASDGTWWHITATDNISNAATGYSVNLTLPHNNLSTPSLCRYPGTSGGYGWDCFTPNDFNTITTTLTGVTAFSDWTVGDDPGPTVTQLVEFGYQEQTNIQRIGIIMTIFVFSITIPLTALEMRIRSKSKNGSVQ